jgi:hypothetical protein
MGSQPKRPWMNILLQTFPTFCILKTYCILQNGCKKLAI